MEVANPICDAAFSTSLQDDGAARLHVGRIADMRVESLDLRPQERATLRDAERADPSNVLKRSPKNRLRCV